MFHAWRIVRKVYAPLAFTGRGSYQFGGRWSHPGIPAVYLADSLALAVLEVLVHNNLDKDHIEEAYFQFHIEIPKGMLEDVGPPDNLPDDWGMHPPPNSTMDMGTEWLQSGRSLGLIVPSTVIQIQKNIVINPRHPDFDRIKIHEPETVRIDPRLIR